MLRNGLVRGSYLGETVNISSIGAVLSTDARLHPGESVEYVITLPAAPDVGRVRIRCLGKVLRTEEDQCAVTLERYEFIRDSLNGATSSLQH